MRTFSWLHLTDLHQGMWSQDWLWPNVREEFFADLGRLHEACGPWDVVLFTGDLTQKGTAEEFEKLDQTLAQVWERLAALGSKPVLLAVPGNHDLARPKQLRPVHRLLAGWVNNAEAHEDLWTDETSESRVAITQMFAAYQGWWAKHELKLPHGWQLRHGLLPGDWSLTIPHGDRRVGVVGLNSSYVQLREGNFEHKLHLDTRQFHAACGGDGPRWVEQHDVSLLLTHHGPGWFGPDGHRHLREEIDVPGRFVAHLHGHMHEQQQYVSAEAGSHPRRRWQGPSLFGLEWFEGKVERVHGYTAGRIEFDASDSSVAHVRLWPRNAVKTGSGKRTLGVDRSIEVDGDGGTRAERIELRRIDPILARRRQLERDFQADGDVTKFEAGDAQLLAQVQDPPAQASKVLGGRYQLWHSLGSGGFAEIWGAFDRSTSRPVVIKMLHRHWSSDRSRAERFEQGAREMRLLSHPALVPILDDVARDEAGRLYYPMRWLLGGDLHARITAGNIERSAALEALARALEGLEHAHERGLVHRDIKPSNILLDDDDRGWLSDFDLVRGSESAAHTRVGQGTRAQAYVAPEVIDDEVSDHRADVYGAGMCALFVLGGRNPPSHVAALKPEYIDALDCSEPLRAAVRRAVAIKPAKRSRSCRPLIDALRGHASPSVAEAWRIAVVEATRSAAPPRPTWIHETGTDEFGEWASFRVGTVEQRMRKLAAGSFLMGSPAGEPGRYDDEGPQHTVVLSQGFWLADSPCTQALWQAVMGGNPSELQSPERPVENVSWDDVQLFLAQLEGRVPGLGAVLPTEAQWEYACRAATTTATYAGPIQILGQHNAHVLDAIAWYGGNSGVDWDLDHGYDSAAWAEKQYPHAVAGTRIVKLKRPNAWGLYDMLGNVWQWCADGKRTYASSPEQDPVGPPGLDRVIRGGGYWGQARLVRAAYRLALEPGERSQDLGFRIARGQGLR